MDTTVVRKISLWAGAAALVLLLAAASPWGGTPEIYRGGALLLLGIVLAICSGYAFVAALIRKKWKGVLLHAGFALIIIGALIDLKYGQRANFGIYVGPQYSSGELYDEETGRIIPLNFKFTVTDFVVDYYPAAFWLCEREQGELRHLERAVIEDGVVNFEGNKVKLNEKELRNADGEWVQVLSLPNNRLCALERPLERGYRANLTIERDNQAGNHVLSVNQPLDVGGWRFYLMDHGQRNQKPFVRLLAKHSPGAFWIKSGLWLLMGSTLIWSFTPKKRKRAL